MRPTQTLANNKEALANTAHLASAGDLQPGQLVRRRITEVLASRLAFPDLEPGERLCKLMDLGKLVPGNPQFEELGRQMQPAIDQCVAVAAMTDAADQAKNMNLPFGILAGPEREMQVVPGTVPGCRVTATEQRGGRVKRTVIAGAGLVVLLGASACSSEGIYAVPLPGGPDVGSNPMNLTIEFDDVLDLVPQSAVKVDGVPVGRVEKIGVGPDGWTADVGIILDSSVDLPANAVAAVEQTNLLGEKFIQLSAPPSGADTTAQLSDGDLIPLDRTRHATEIEQVLGALSLLLNGGGVGQLQPIVKELGAAFDGREGTTRSLLEQAESVHRRLERTA